MCNDAAKSSSAAIPKTVATRRRSPCRNIPDEIRLSCITSATCHWLRFSRWRMATRRSLSHQLQRMSSTRRRKQVVDYVLSQKEPAYAFNRGFGHNVDLAIGGGPDRLAALQTNLIRSHATCVGEPAPDPVVRATMILRANSLARGYSGVRAVVVEQLCALLNADITPVVPRHGSVSASGDLAPLSHVALALLGEGDVLVNGQRMSAADALQQASIAPLSARNEGRPRTEQRVAVFERHRDRCS